MRAWCWAVTRVHALHAQRRRASVGSRIDAVLSTDAAEREGPLLYMGAAAEQGECALY